jgi:ATP-dependent Clp protease ATP-binding subunit ClpA
VSTDLGTIDGLPLAPRAQGAIEAAVREARWRGHGFLGTEHLLLGMLAEPDAVATRVLDGLGITAKVRAKLAAVFEEARYPSEGPPPYVVADWELRHQLLARRQRDQELRGRRMTFQAGPRGEMPGEARAFIDELQEVDRENTEWLKSVVRTRGWPGRSLVGADAAHAAWLLAQHADGNPAFQRECLALLEDTAERGEAQRSHVAYLTDRVHLAEGRLQRYGTQLTRSATGEMVPRPIEDPDSVDERRATVGLEPLSAYVERTTKLLAQQTASQPRKRTSH